MNRATVNKIFQKHPVYVKAGMIAVISIIIFGCVYSKDNGKKLEKDEKGREILRRNESGKDELKNMKVKIDEKQEDISISVSGKKYDEEELKNAFSEAEKEVEQAVLGKNKSLDEVRSDLNLITSVPEKNMKVSWELDRYDVMDIQGHLQQDNLSTEGTLIKLTVILTYEDEEERYEFYAKVFPSELTADKEEMRQLQEKVEEADKKTKTKDYIVLPEQVNGKKVIWAYGVQTRAYGILVMGIGFAVFVIISSSQKEKEEKKWVNVMALSHNKSFMKIDARIEGNQVKGHRSTVLYGQEAIEYQANENHKQDNLVSNPENKVSQKEKLTVTNLKVKKQENDWALIEEEFDFVLQADRTDDHLYINPMLFPQLKSNPFIQTERVLPIEFPYPYKFTMLSTLTLPEGYEVEELPQSQSIRSEGDGLQCKYMIQQQGNTILLNYVFHLKGYIFLSEQYKQLQELWTKVIEKNNALIVLKKI